jgi:hypothetical protein
VSTLIGLVRKAEIAVIQRFSDKWNERITAENALVDKERKKMIGEATQKIVRALGKSLSKIGSDDLIGFGGYRQIQLRKSILLLRQEKIVAQCRKERERGVAMIKALSAKLQHDIVLEGRTPEIVKEINKFENWSPAMK